MSFANALWKREIPKEAPEALGNSTIDTHLAAPAAGAVLEGGSAPEIFQLPEGYTHTQIGGFSEASTFYGVDSLGNEIPTGYMG